MAATDVTSNSMLRGGLLPLLDFLFLVYLVLWFVDWRLRQRNRRSEQFMFLGGLGSETGASGHDASGIGGDGDGSGDCGGD